MRFSPFNPILFGDVPFTDFPHVFSVTDNIMIECFKKPEEPLPSLKLTSDNNISYDLSWNIQNQCDEDIAFYILRGLTPGDYVLTCGDIRSNQIIVTDSDEVLSNTVLLQFCENSNRSRVDIATLINLNKVFFDFRIPGGFKDNDWSFNVDNEQFETEESDIYELYSIDSTFKTLTIGTSIGVPTWIAEMVNKAFACELVYVDGIKYNRVNEAVPEAVAADNYNGRVIYNFKLQQCNFIKPNEFKEELVNRLALRRTPTNFRKTAYGFRKILVK